jgi:predicted nucleic acid-binding protein
VRILLDTNVLLRNADQADPAHARVSAALQRLVQNGWDLCVGSQNLVEFWVVATRPVSVNGFGLSPAQAEPRVRAMMVTFSVLRDPPDLLERWLDLCSRYGVSGRPAHDTRLVALMLAHGLTHLLTLNSADFARYAEITTVTPDDV